MNSKVDVTIFCMTYNHAKYVAKTIDGFLMQKTSYTYEIVIHDDASTDDTQKIIKFYQSKYPNIIKPILQTENQYSKNAVHYFITYLDKLNGEFIAFCEGDDYWTDYEKLQKQVTFIKQHPNCTLCTHATDYENAQGEIKNIELYKNNAFLETKDIILLGGGYLKFLTWLMRKDVLLKEIPNFIMAARASDYVFLLWCAFCGSVYFSCESMGVYRDVTAGGFTDTLLRNLDKRLVHKINEIEIYKKFNEYTGHEYNDEFLYAATLSQMEIIFFADEFKMQTMKKFMENIKRIEKPAYQKSILEKYEHFGKSFNYK
jgi:glycosyltransferase involved in cell wall biosynthesis